MSENPIITKNNFINEIKKETIISINYDIELGPNLDLNKIKELNNKCSELIYEEKIDESFRILKKLEIFFESNAINPNFNLEKKILLIILHNLACCYQKIKDYDNCINYLDAVIYHYDTSLEKRHNIKIEENYFVQHMNENKTNYQLLGDLILELRFSAKFHIQMSEILSQVNRHTDALKHAKLASLICEDNLIKSNYLYTQIKDNLIKSTILSKKNINDNNNANNTENEDDIFINDKIKLNYKLIQELFNIIVDIRDSNKKKKVFSISNKVLNNRFESLKENNENKKNFFNSYDNYRQEEIKQFKYKNSLNNKVRYIFGGILKPGDWIQIITIDNILVLSPLNSEDLDLDSDSRYELLRDTILEKIVMLTTSYFCVSREMNFLSKNKNNKKTNGAYYLYKAIELSFMFLPVSCPIINFFISNYYKKYGQDMDVIPEGKVVELKVNLIRDEIEENKDSIYFIGLKKINYKIINNHIDNPNDIFVCKNDNKNSVLIPRLNINNNNNDNKANSLNNNINNNLSPNIKLMNSIDVNNNSKINSNINTNTNSNSKRKKSKNDKKSKPKSGDKTKKKSAPQKIKKYKSKPLSNNSTQINNLNISYNSISNKATTFYSSYNNNKNNTNNKRRKNKTKSTSKNKNKNDLESKNKFNNQKKPNINFNVKNIDLLPNKNFFNFANKSKINEKLAPKFRLNFAKLNFSENDSDYSNDNDNVQSNPNINSMNNILTKFSTTKSNSSSKKNNELTAGKFKKNKLNKKAFSINLNDNFIVYGKGLKTERLQNPKMNVDKNLYNKSGINRNKNMKNFDKKKLNFNLSPKYDYTSIIIKRKELKGNQTDRILHKNKLSIKNKYNNNNNNKINNRLNDKINDIKIKFNSPQGRKDISKTYRFFNQDKNSSKKEKNNLTKNNSFKSNFNNKKLHINSIRYQNFKNSKSPKYSQSYYINNTNNSNHNNINCVKDISTIKSMEMIGMLFFNKKKKTYSSENSSFQRPFKNKINLNKHHLNENLVTHFKNMKF